MNWVPMFDRAHARIKKEKTTSNKGKKTRALNINTSYYSKITHSRRPRIYERKMRPESHFLRSNDFG